MFDQLNGIKQEQEKSLNKLQKKTITNEKIEAINNEAAVLEVELIDLKATHAKLSARSNLIELVLIQRQDFAQSILPLLTNTIPNEVMLDELIEKEWYQFNIKGRALDQASIDNFNSVLSRALEPWEMYISESPSYANGMRYDFSFTIRAKES